MTAKKYHVGIDLGTTNCVVSYMAEDAENVSLLAIPQIMADGSVKSFEYLPSAIYLLAKDEQKSFTLPWGEQNHARQLVGQGALELGQRRANQLVQSAKSWLSHRNVDRHSPILPWGSDIDYKISPVHASQLLLEHLKNSWDHAFPDALLAQQKVALTLPASFDAEARALTLEAAKLAGLDDLYLLEEPQAACYQYIHSQGDLAPLTNANMLLVVDIGGGTCDFSLVAIRQPDGKIKEKGLNQKQPAVSLQRIAVGQHLLLGGDNLDQALAYQLDPQQVSSLSTARLAALVQQTKKTKETLLGDDAPQTMNITVLGGGRQLIGGSQKFSVTREALLEQVKQGFFPIVEKASVVEKHQYAVHALGLPYETDAAFTRHLAQFLRSHEQDIQSATGHSMPDAVLFNGGMFNSLIVKQRVLEQLNAWSSHAIVECLGNEPNQAVAKGACLYLNALAGKSTQIESGAAHSLYLQVGEGEYVNILPKGTPTGQPLSLPTPFKVTLGETVQFPLYQADDALIGELGDIHNDDRLTYISSLVTELETKLQDTELEVRLHILLTEVGLLKLVLKSGEDSQEWTLSFAAHNSASQSESEQSEGVLANRMGEAEEHLVKCFSKVGQKQSADLIKTLRQDLESILGPRNEWNLVTIRRLADKLLSLKSGRNKSAQHEKQWLQWLGFCLRPGYGAQHDEERVSSVVNLTQAGVQFDTAPVWGQYWTLYRRIANGLPLAQQNRLFKEFSQFYSPAGLRSREKSKQLLTRSSDDLIRLVGAFESLSLEDKTTLIDWLAKRLKKSSESDTAWWTIGRIASRKLLSQQQENVYPEEGVLPLLDFALKEDWKKRKQAGLAAVLMCQVSLEESNHMFTYRKKVEKKLKKDKCPKQWIERLQSVEQMSEDELNELVGENIPIGLTKL
ncbi:Hsp70 family protein [Marinomonas epiphytica]